MTSKMEKVTMVDDFLLQRTVIFCASTSPTIWVTLGTILYGIPPNAWRDGYINLPRTVA